MNTQTLSISLGIIGPLGLLTFLIMAGVVARHYWGSRTGSLRWHIRNLRLKQISAIASLFCLAMASSYGIIQEAWALIYLIIAFKTGTWWLRIAINQRS
ncbi:MAG: hypothetical protein JO215_14470 [Ktedonobacteraceae bacterium]|nr:hypothetical protein [Ktedonobacteraceae bacterium]